MRFPVMLVSLLALASCAKPPYVGLDKNSYGPLIAEVDRGSGSFVPVTLCDPDARNAGGIHEISRQITGALFKPLGGLSKIDESIVREDLQSHFLMPGDPGGEYTITLLERDNSRIAFWYIADLVALKEVGEAAADYCRRKGAQLAYEGSSRRCSEPKIMPVVVNGKQTMINTYAISSFRCVGGNLPARQFTPVESAFDPNMVRAVQTELVRLKYLSGGVDGSMGPATRAAISAFQKSQSIPVNGTPTASLLQSLKGAGNPQ